MKHWRQILYGVLIGLLATGAILLISQPARGKPIVLAPAPTPTNTPPPKPTRTPAPIQVQIFGEILKPGVYSLPVTARLSDLIVLAGGFTRQADEDRINLAALLRDGNYFYIPAFDEAIPETATNAPGKTNLGSGAEFNYPININEASKEAFESLPGIGPTKAEDIISYRDNVGTFITVDDLLLVPGIGPSTLDAIRDYIVVEP